MAWFSRKVSVTFIDEATGVTFAKTEMQSSDLPETFELETTLHLGKVDWSVVHAEPQTRNEFAKSRSLTLRLRKIEKIPPGEISFSQLDITERFDDDRHLGKDEWISTSPLNTRMSDPESSGLPPLSADADETYRVAVKLSALREMIPVPNDGVYCPICHIANIELEKLRTPCPQCGRALLKFGWD